MTLRIGYELRKKNVHAGELRILVSYSDEKEERGSVKLRHPLFLDDYICAVSSDLFKRTVKRRIRIRAIEIQARRLSRSLRQLELFDETAEREKQISLNRALDSLRRRFGEGTVLKAAWL